MSRPVPLGREAFKAWRVFATRWADNDAYGHVNNTVFYQWFDSAVNAWLIDNHLLDIERGDPIGLVVETRCSFFAPLTYPKPVEVGIGVAHLGTSSVRYRVGIFDVGAAESAAHGEFVHVYVDRQNRRPMPLPDEWR
ncbi:MAG TPA: thioesterase family protein, partial [Sphingomicrobium sp.]|nr:thioesterase family protein [Sphingomicrobium sp.]